MIDMWPAFGVMERGRRIRLANEAIRKRRVHKCYRVLFFAVAARLLRHPGWSNGRAAIPQYRRGVSSL